MDDPRRITIRMGEMAFELPKRLGPKHRGVIARLVKVKATLAELADQPDGEAGDVSHLEPDGEAGDVSHLADAVDALELLANLGRRMRASRPRKDGAS